MIRSVMGYQPPVKSPKRAIHKYRQPLREKRKEKKRIQRRGGRLSQEKKPIATEKEVIDKTLKQLHTLGNQKFGSSPFSQHFDRWLTDLTIVLGEFESYPNLCIDDQFVRERSQTFSIIKQQLEERSRKEVALEQEIRNLSDSKKTLEQINIEYTGVARGIKTQKNREVKNINKIIDCLKKDQEKIIQMKTGFFHGISKKDREQKENKIVQQLDDKQRELELVVFDFNSRQKKVLYEYEIRRQPVLEQIKKSKKLFQTLETDDSLEERWFACEALVDSVITFLQRKTAEPSLGSN